MNIPFEWDEQKRLDNIRKHGIDFVDAPEIFKEPFFARQDTRKSYGEDRFIAYGELRGRVVVVVYTTRSESIRLISVRKANDREVKIYEKTIRNRF